LPSGHKSWCCEYQGHRKWQKPKKVKTKALCEFRFPDQLLSNITLLVCLNYTNCITCVLTIFGVQDSALPPLEPMGIILQCCNLRWFPSIALRILSAHHFLAWLARAPSKLDRLSMRAEQFREITGRFLLNELGDPHFLIRKFKRHTVTYNISRFQEKLKILLWDIFI